MPVTRNPSEEQAARQLRTPDRVVVGRIVASQGLAGEMRIYPLTDFPDRFADTKALLATHPSGRTLLLTPQKARLHKKMVILKCQEIDSIADLTPWIASELSIAAAELRELPPGRFYVFQIIGLKVVCEDGFLLGEISDVIFPGANDVYVVKLTAEAAARAVDCDGVELLLPVIDEVILQTDLEEGVITVRLLPGLL